MQRVDAFARGVSLGASPRGIQALILAAKVKSLLDRRFAVSRDDISAVARPALRHRIIVNYQALARGEGVEQMIDAGCDMDVLTRRGHNAKNRPRETSETP